MSPEERSLLQNTYEIAQENNKLLRSLVRSGRISTIMRVAYWVVIIGLSFGAFYFIQPYINYLTGISGQSGSTNSTIQQMQDLLK